METVEVKVAAPPRVGLWLRGIPAGLKVALIAEANDRALSLNDVAVEVISDRLGRPYTPTSKRKTNPRADKLDIILSVSPDVRRDLKILAAGEAIPMRDLVVKLLCEAFHVPFEKAPPRNAKRRTPRRRLKGLVRR